MGFDLLHLIFIVHIFIRSLRSVVLVFMGLGQMQEQLLMGARMMLASIYRRVSERG